MFAQLCWLTPWAVQNSSILRWLRKQEGDDVKSQMAVGREFQAAGPDTEKLRDQYRDSRERRILGSRREHDRVT